MKLLFAFATAALITAPALSVPCRGPNGKFVKCAPTSTATAMPAGVTKDAKGRCHATGGKFVACPK